MNKQAMSGWEKNLLLVSGFVREQTLDIKFFLNMMIPIALVELICQFYPYNIFCIDPKYKSENIEISNNGHLFRLSNNAAVYSNNVVEIGTTYEWTIEIKNFNLKTTNSHHPYVGIIKNIDTLMERWKIEQYDETMHHNGNSYILCCGQQELRPHSAAIKAKGYGEKCRKVGSIIIVKLDLIEFTLSYNINGKDYGIAFQVIEKGDYRLLVAMTYSGKGTEIELH